MFARLASFVARYWVLVLAAWVVIPVGIHLVAPRWDDVAKEGDFAYLPDRMTSCRGDKLISLAFPNLAECKSESSWSPGRTASSARKILPWPAGWRKSTPPRKTTDADHGRVELRN